MGASLSSACEAAAAAASNLLSDTDASASHASLGTLRVSTSLRKKLGHGVRINLKVLIRGDTGSGKTACLRRLQGLGFTPELPPSRAVDVATIDWSYGGGSDDSEDSVKVEAWDVADAGLRQQARRIELLHHQGSPSAPTAAHIGDAAAAAWHGAHGAIVLFDPRKPWTFQYVLRLLEEAPQHIPCLVLANFSDVVVASDAASSGAGHGGARRPAGAAAAAVSWGEVEAAVRDEAARTGRIVVCARGSMRDCSGLDVLHAFLSLPFLQAKRDALVAAQSVVDERLRKSEDAVRALAAGDAPPSSWHALSGGWSASVATEPPQALHSPAAAVPWSPARAQGGAPLATATPLPRIAPPPDSRTVPSNPSTAMAPIRTPPAPVALVPAIDDAFFGDDDEPPPASPDVAVPRVAAAPAVAAAAAADGDAERRDVLTPNHSAPQAAAADDDSDEVEDLLPLLEDPDDE